jgi:hypothetical protein
MNARERCEVKDERWYEGWKEGKRKDCRRFGLV